MQLASPMPFQPSAALLFICHPAAQRRDLLLSLPLPLFVFLPLPLFVSRRHPERSEGSRSCLYRCTAAIFTKAFVFALLKDTASGACPERSRRMS
jgi:hypothetical protein